MAKAMLLIAAASASAGAAVTAILLGRRDSQPPSGSVMSPTSPSTAKPSTPTLASSDGAQSTTKGVIDPNGWFSYGAPGPTNDLASRTSFISVYDRRMRNPAWVAEHITAESLSGSKGDRKNSVFLEDQAVPEIFRAKLKDYFRSGYDRGHMAPAADAKFNQKAMDETFYLTNMCPQVGEGFNRDYWAHLEDFCRRLTSKYRSIRVITGPLYLPKLDSDGKYRVSYEVIGSPPNVAVPTHFYKIILGESATTPSPTTPVAIGAFVLPNAPIDNKTPLSEFSVPVEVIEKASGLEFLSLVPTERRRSLCREVDCSILVREFPKRPPKAPGHK
ncbi:nuclease [Orbilia blumenaviensis]|uniref:Endonuclease n=1 Tax=Orbilia blumenaviensis TaxID=1796055 RepID=A0AAV9TW97_9PEZI